MKKDLEFKIRYPKQADFKSAHEYINKLSKEKTFVRFQGEKISLKVEKKWIRSKLKDIKNKKSIVLFLNIENKIHGICNVDLHDKTESHVASLGLSVDSSIRGKGLGEKLLINSINEAIKNLKGLKIIILEVKSPNLIAINLYKKVGFKKYGQLPNGSIHKEKFVDTILMFKKVG